ncbi:ERI1 exoribonuclease 2-like [Neodiprion fabricii]|uniref:ERI1 exoribonuclease 2-like n=1 Tax=Neodiprion fabricii TaxID=2872261 RepID=UPI001ED92EBD|nr:ERI1 exoribonuclease 2-like [Neodiprion fabricii]
MAEDRTESLARRLNLVERLVIPESAAGGSRNPEGPRHLIALKLLSTKTDESSTGTDGEVIDFAAVVVSLVTENIVAAFHQHVMPTEQPTLSSHCVQSTGVSQEAADNGVPLKTCLMLYSNWLVKLEKDVGLKLPSKQDPKNPVTIPVTWSDLDLGTCLPIEARRKRLVYVKHLSTWLDLRAIWIEHYKTLPRNMRDAMARMKLKWKEKEYLSLEYATNIANLALAMREKGCELKITSSV